MVEVVCSHRCAFNQSCKLIFLSLTMPIIGFGAVQPVAKVDPLQAEIDANAEVAAALEGVLPGVGRVYKQGDTYSHFITNGEMPEASPSADTHPVTDESMVNAPPFAYLSEYDKTIIYDPARDNPSQADWTVLMHAANKGHYCVLESLLNACVDANAAQTVGVIEPPVEL